MAEFYRLAVGTISMRPYVFAFFAAYLLVAIPHLGWRRITLFTIIGYLVAFTSEFCSINTGFPYGWYYYIDKTSSSELWIAGVPFFDSLSYVFLCYCSYATAIFISSPLKKCHGIPLALETIRLRRSFAVLLMGTLLQVYLDIIIDPVALQGHKWFLGRIYGYRENGAHFGVPLTNYVGWFVVSALMILILQRISIYGSDQHNAPSGVRQHRFGSILPPILYLAIITFNIVIAFSIGELTIAITGLFIAALPVLMTVILAVRRINHFSREEIAEHLSDFPWSIAGSRK